MQNKKINLMEKKGLLKRYQGKQHKKENNMSSTMNKNQPSNSIVDGFWKLILIVCMLLGRLELYTVLLILLPTFWRK